MVRPAQEVAQIVAEVRAGAAQYGGRFGENSGIIDSQKTVGSWPELRSNSPPSDLDHDGLPDQWERQHGFDPENLADGSQDADGDGYTNLEEYLNGTKP